MRSVSDKWLDMANRLEAWMVVARTMVWVLRAKGPKAALARAAVAREAIATGAGSIVIVADVAVELLLLKCGAGRL